MSYCSDWHGAVEIDDNYQIFDLELLDQHSNPDYIIGNIECYSCFLFNGLHCFRAILYHDKFDDELKLTKYSIVKPLTVKQFDPAIYLDIPLSPTCSASAPNECGCCSLPFDPMPETISVHDHSRIYYVISNYQIIKRYQITLGADYRYSPIPFLSSAAISKIIEFNEMSQTGAIFQVLDIITCNRINRAIYEYDAKYQIVISDGQQLIHAVISANISHFIEQGNVRKFDIVHVLKWTVTRGKQIKTGLFIDSNIQHLSKCSAMIGKPRPYHHEYPSAISDASECLSYLLSPELLSKIQRLKCGCSCIHKRDIKDINTECEQFAWGKVEMAQCLMLPHLIKTSLNELDTQGKRHEMSSKLFKILDSRWTFCKHCVVQFIFDERNLKQLVNAIKRRCDFNNNQNFDWYCSAMLAKIMHYPLIAKYLVRNHGSLILEYWVKTIILWCIMIKPKMSSDISNRNNLLRYTECVQNLNFCILKLFEMNYIRQEHVKFIMDASIGGENNCKASNILDELISYLRMYYLKISLPSSYHAQTVPIQKLSGYRIICYLLGLFNIKHKQWTLIANPLAYADALYNEKTDGINECALMLKYGQMYIYQVMMKQWQRKETKWVKQVIKASITRWRSIGSQCQNMKCHRMGKGLKICKGCKIVYYCSKRCQKIDWLRFNHGMYCKLL
eukprot:180048_1